MKDKKPKILIIGAGSFFTNFWINDILLIPQIDGGTIALVDVDSHRLNLTLKMAEKMLKLLGKEDKWTLEASTDRRKLMPGTDYLVNTIEVAGVNNVRYDYEIPKKYGVDQCIGDTLGPGGVMKALRTIPAWLKILKDAEELCPDALVLNYTNPMGMMVLAGVLSSKMQIVGLCHSVQGSSRQLAEYAGVPYEEMEWECAGINHLAWFTKLRYDGKDLYPVLKEKAKDPEFFKKDPVRFELMLQLGYFPTESSGHVSEYVPFFRKRPDLIEKYCGEGYKGESGFYSRNWVKWRTSLDEVRQKWLKGEKITEEDLKKCNLPSNTFENLGKRSLEYASYIIEAHFTGKPFVIHGNVFNAGLIDNLPEGVVEVPILVDKTGFHPCKFGKLPQQLAALDQAGMVVQNLCVKGILEKDREAIIHAIMLDPLVSAVCSLEEARNMAEELFEAEKEYIPDFLTKRIWKV
ncbi:MAG TPA: alpha-galactosidase [Thermotogales bacterium]|nr:alpha-galactosidase [Thermotogales bacterium]